MMTSMLLHVGRAIVTAGRVMVIVVMAVVVVVALAVTIIVITLNQWQRPPVAVVFKL